MGARRMDRRWIEIALVWAALALALGVSSLSTGSPPWITGDNAMHMVGAIDLLSGQSWFDTIQHRDNVPFGASMHFSRLVDGPLALLVAALTSIAGADAPGWAAFVWPLLVLFVAVALVSRLTEAVAGPAARLPALALLAMCLPVYTEFVPGRVDHHNVQIVLTLGMMLLAVEGRSDARRAIGAAGLAAAGIAVGTEILPSVIALLVAFGLFWVVDPARSRGALLALALAFPAALLVLLVATMPPASWLTPVCDALSPTYVVAGTVYGLAVLVTLAVAGRARSPLVRLLVLGAAGGVAIVLLLLAFPACRSGPYGNLDADLADVLLPQIGEAQPLWVWAAGMRPQLALLVAPLAGLAALVYALWRCPPDRRDRWLVLGGFCLMLLVVAMAQMRGTRLLGVALLPAGAFVVASAWARLRQRQTLGAAALAGLAVLTFSGLAHWTIAVLAAARLAPAVPSAERIAWQACEAPAAFAPLAALPPSRVIAYLIIGPQILIETPHSIVSAGYHRNEQGLRDMIRFFGGGEAEARDVVAERELDYLVFCNGIDPADGLAGVAPFPGLGWSWLTPVSPPDAPIQIYAINR